MLAGLTFVGGLLGDNEIADALSTAADVRAMLRFEIELVRAQATAGMVDEEAAAAIESVCTRLVPDMEELTSATARDGVVVPELVRQLRNAVGEPHGRFIHLGATSQDVIDTAMALKLAFVLDVFNSRLSSVLSQLDVLQSRFGRNRLMGRTRMQAAVPITVGDRLKTWKSPLQHLVAELPRQRERVLILTLAGAAGTSEKFDDKIVAVRQSMARNLGLFVPDYVPHTDRGRIADFAGFLSRLTGAFGKIGQDLALMVQNGIDEAEISGGGGSSAMPHKQNPVRAEILVALARYNATLLAGVHQALVHEQERSGSAWTLEWLLMPQMIEASGLSLLHGSALLSSIERFGDPA